MRIALIEPHLLRFGGIRRMIEFANGLVLRGHDVTFFLPPEERMQCAWMRCSATVKPLRAGYSETFDVVIANEETQWHLLRLFSGAHRTVFYFLHDGTVYGKPGSWEAMRTPVHAQLANSNWTADRVQAATGHRPTVVLGGVNREVFKPSAVPKRYPILCVGDARRWKGTSTIEQAGELLGLPVERYGPKGLPQRRMAAEIGAAEVFVVGSLFEGFCQPGLEALACGTPLVTTDNGGCREYAHHGETALVVPPADAAAMAEAIQRLRSDHGMAQRLIDNGLALVEERFSWARATKRLESVLSEIVEAPDERLRLSPNLTNSRSDEPTLSVVVLAWDQVSLTLRCVHSIRNNTDVDYELILVDNGSAPEGACYAKQAADVPILNPTNLGFSRGMNQGLAAARGKYVAFVNNDTELPAGWASRLTEVLGDRERAAIVVPAVTSAGNQRTVRVEAGEAVEQLAPFEAPPSGVVYVMPTEVARALGGWGEEYLVASGEDVDLCFKVWVNGLDVIFDQRVLVQHVGKGTAGAKLPDWEALWRTNREVFLEKWTSRHPAVPRVASCSEEDFCRNLAIARSVAGWMRRYFSVRRFVPVVGRTRVLRVARPVVAGAASFLRQRRDNPRVVRIVSWAERRRSLSLIRRFL